MEAQPTLLQVLAELSPADRINAKTFHNAVYRRLVELGCIVRREVAAPYYSGDENFCPRKVRRGRIDLMVDAPFQAAIELDNFTPRTKSIRKLGQFTCEKFVALRNTPEVLIQL